MKKRYTLTLLEISLALVLAGILLTLLFQYLGRTVRADIEAVKLEEAKVPLEIIRIRLSRLFETLSPLKGDTLPLFYTKKLPKAQNLALHFTTTGNLDPDPDFCLGIENNLYLSSEGDVCLTSSFNQKKRKEQILLQNIASLKFSFYNLDTLEWQDSWDKKKPLPPLFKMILTPKGSSTPEEYVFFLNNPPIVYSLAQ